MPIQPTGLPLPRSGADLGAVGLGVGTAQASGEPAIERVLTDTGPQFSPAFGRAGGLVFFHTGRTGDRASALMVGRVDGGQVETVLNDGARNYHVQPSPDGRSIAFDSDRDGERGVYVATRDGAEVRRVSGTGYAAVPSWSPAGDQITFIRAEAGRPKVWNLWLLSVETGETLRLTNYRYGQTWGAAWFGNGQWVCYTHEDRLIVHNVQTGVRREYPTPVPGRIVRTPAVSPSGDAIVFQVYRNGMWLLDLRSNTMHPVLRDRSAEEFSWSPNGRRIAFHSRRNGEWGIWAVVSSEVER